VVGAPPGLVRFVLGFVLRGQLQEQLGDLVIRELGGELVRVVGGVVVGGVVVGDQW
jgi:hypothetical protein